MIKKKTYGKNFNDILRKQQDSSCLSSDNFEVIIKSCQFTFKHMLLCILINEIMIIFVMQACKGTT